MGREQERVKKRIENASSIAKEYRALLEKETVGTDITYQNQIMFGGFDVNLVCYTEKKSDKDGNEKTTEFAWITSIQIKKRMQRNW